MDRADFRRHWREAHGPLLMKIPTMRRYAQSHVVPDPSQPEPACDGVAEMWFDSVTAFQEALASPEGQAGMADLPNFCDPTKLQIFYVEEVPFR
jgi:uncharacterized protein (TIGR02118 family)